MIQKPARFTGGLFCWSYDKDKIWRIRMVLYLDFFCLKKLN